MNENKNQYVMKKLEEMNVIDDFLFSEIMADEENGLEVCRMILSCVSITKSRKEIGIKYMKSWERERQVREEGREEGRDEGRYLGKRELIDELLKNGEITPECAEKYSVKRDGSF